MTERALRHAELVDAYNSALDGSANAAELWDRVKLLKHAYARDYPYELVQHNESDEGGKPTL